MTTADDDKGYPRGVADARRPWSREVVVPWHQFTAPTGSATLAHRAEIAAAFTEILPESADDPGAIR